ncbi:MAG: hypothetical protein IJ852_05140 [Alphaproteobacteria bacterium]|nr:hypothetical protein [Alphaproteobacteria bacterium]
MKKYDLIIPLGEFCATAIALRDAGIRQASYPFDWSAGVEWDKCGNCGFLGKIKMICNDFKDALNLEDFREEWGENRAHRRVINKKTGLQYVHDFEWEKSVVEQFPAFKEKYERRIKRLYDDIHSNKKILFVFATRGVHTLPFSDVQQGFNLLSKKFPQKTFQMVIIYDSSDCNINEFSTFKLSDQIDVITYHDIEGGYGNQPIMQKILKTFITDECDYNFATDHIKNFGLSCRENWGRWSDGQIVCIKIPFYADKKAAKIQFDIQPYVVKEHPVQDVDVYFDNKKIAHWHFEISKHFPETVLKIPARKIKGDMVDLMFKINNPAEIKTDSNGGVIHTRKLGIGFKTMKIMAR